MSFKLRWKLKVLFLFTLFKLINCDSLSLAQAKPPQDPKTNNIEAPNTNSSKLKLPARGSPVGRRRGGTSRNNCLPLDSPLTALVPGSETSTGLVQSKSYLASTISENPTFWVYIPKLPDQMQTGEFILQTEAGQDIKRTQIKLPSTESVIAITLPPNSEHSLTIGKKYHWYFKIYCGKSILQSDYFFIDAWIERIEASPELKYRLQTTNLANHLIHQDLYVWYDAITILGQKLLVEPNDDKLQTDWVQMLKSIDLLDISNSSIIKVYQL